LKIPRKSKKKEEEKVFQQIYQEIANFAPKSGGAKRYCSPPHTFGTGGGIAHLHLPGKFAERPFLLLFFCFSSEFSRIKNFVPPPMI
jgi:hypothetical protein